MKKVTITLATLALGAGLALAAPGDGAFRGGMHGMHGKHMRGDFGARMAAKLGLTEAQQAEVKQLHEAFRAQNEPLFTSMRQTHEELRAARQAGNTALASTLAGQAEEQRAEMHQKRQALHEQVLQVLTPEQREQLEAMKAKRAERSEQRRDRRQRGH